MQANCGAAGTRNRLLDDSYGELCIMWDDDTEPLPGCVDAYVKAFRAHPDAAGFAGEST
jgi:GT2 family glycosyltransferase